jgi:hypothetical protein
MWWWWLRVAAEINAATAGRHQPDDGDNAE